MTKYYTGVGSHHVAEIPLSKLIDATTIATELERRGYTLRSGGATGFDQAFERGVIKSTNKVIYLSSKEQRYDARLWMAASALVVNTHPRPSSAHRYMYLLARNAFQVLGDDLRTPSDFVVCWTKNGKDVGGTGTTIRIARLYDVPVYNLHDMTISEIIETITEQS